jgi:hypothetical protein
MELLAELHPAHAGTQLDYLRETRCTSLAESLLAAAWSRLAVIVRDSPYAFSLGLTLMPSYPATATCWQGDAVSAGAVAFSR